MAINVIYGWIFPSVAVVFSLVAFIIKKNVLPPLLSSLFWFVSAYTVLGIQFVLSNEINITYTATGNPEFAYLFGGLGLLFGVFAAFQGVFMVQETVEVAI